MFDKAKFEAGLKKDFNVIAKKVVDKTLDNVVDSLMELSPVGQPEKWTMTEPADDYTPGQYKANWVYSAGTPIYEYFNHEDDRDDSFQQIDCKTGRLLKGHIKENKTKVTHHYFTNSTPYAKSVEFGLVPWQSKHNPQSQSFPHAVAGLTAMRVPELLRQAKQEVLK
jgi:hypothetical protein